MFQVTHSLVLFTIAAWAVTCIWTVLNSRFVSYLDKQNNINSPTKLLTSFAINNVENLDEIGKIHDGPIIPLKTPASMKKNKKKDNKKNNQNKNQNKNSPKKVNPRQRNANSKFIKMEGKSPKELFLERMKRTNKYQDKGKESTTTKDFPEFIISYDESYTQMINITDNDDTINIDTSDIIFDTSIIYMIVPAGYKYIWLENNNNLKFCNGVPTRLGNVLSGYWTARSIAYFLGVQFELVEPHKYAQQRCVNRLSNERVKRVARYFFDQEYVVKYRKSLKGNQDKENIYDGLYWSQYLAKSVTQNSILIDYQHLMDKDIYLEIIEWVYSVIRHVKFEDLSIANGFETKQLTYLSDFRLLWENPLYFNHVLIPSIHDAFNEYMLFIYNKTSEEIRDDIFTSDKDIVLHYRCGDIALVDNLKRHGFLSMSYYKEALDRSGWNKYLNSNQENLTVWVVTQQNNYKCVQIVEAAMPSIIELFKPARVEIVKHKQTFGIEGVKAQNMDFFRMANAPLLLCSTSTFCDQAAIGNINQVMFPSIGCWIGWYKNPQHWHPEYHHYIDVDNETLLLNPGRFNVQYIIDFILNH